MGMDISAGRLIACTYVVMSCDVCVRLIEDWRRMVSSLWEKLLEKLRLLEEAGFLSLTEGVEIHSEG